MKELLDAMKGGLGMVIPVWFPRRFDRARMKELLAMTFHDVGHYIQWTNVLAVVDGAPWVEAVLKELAAELENECGSSFEMLTQRRNQGKGFAVARGFEVLLDNGDINCLCIRDADNDHSIYDLPHLLKTHSQMMDTGETELVVVVGRRRDLYRPLGLWRAEFENILSFCVWEGAKYHLAERGRALNMQWTFPGSPYPDLESGYKVYSRDAAELAAEAIYDAAEKFPGLELGRFGVETVPNVEILARGGLIGETSRMTMEEQPLTTFARDTTLPRLYANQVIYAFRRLQIPPHVAKQLLHNAIPQSLLLRTAEGLQAAREFRSLVFKAMGIAAQEAEKPIHVPETI